MGLHETDLYYLLMRLRTGGTLVSSAGCTQDEVDLARAQGRLFVDGDGHGYLYRPPSPRAEATA